MSMLMYINFQGYDPSEKILEIIQRQISYIYFGVTYNDTIKKSLEGLIAEIFMIHGITAKPRFTWEVTEDGPCLTMENTEIYD